MENGRRFVELVDGRKVPIKAVSMMELELSEAGIREDYLAQGLPIDPPKYTVTTVGGDLETFNHDETTLEVPGDEAKTAANMSAWAAYKAARSKMEAEIEKIRTEILLDGLDVELPDDNTWERVRRKRHIRVPDDPDDKLMFYKQMVVMKAPEDIYRIMEEIMVLSSTGTVKEEEIRAAARTFRRSLEEEPERSETGEGPGESAAPSGKLESQPTAKRRKRG